MFTRYTSLMFVVSAFCLGCQGNERIFVAEQEFDEQLELAIDELSTGASASAKERLDWLLDHPLPERPNHLAFLYGVAALCAIGDLEDGTKLLEDGKCMVRVVEGSQACYEQGYPLEVVRANGLTDTCFEQMCGEILVDSSGFSKGTEDEILRARNALVTAGAMCSAEQ